MPLGLHLRRRRKSPAPSTSSIVVPQQERQNARSSSSFWETTPASSEHVSEPSPVPQSSISRQSTAGIGFSEQVLQTAVQYNTAGTPHVHSLIESQKVSTTKPRDLWNVAYQILCTDEPKLLKQYEAVLLLEDEENSSAEPSTLGRLNYPPQKPFYRNPLFKFLRYVKEY